MTPLCRRRLLLEAGGEVLGRSRSWRGLYAVAGDVVSLNLEVAHVDLGRMLDGLF